jgi:DNA-binding response OmpR family regulator
VDDNRTSADSLGWVLKHWGHQAVALYDGRSALEAIATFGPDVVIADLDLPDLDGYEVAARLGERRARGEVRLIALTGMDASEVKQEHVHLFDDHFTKPLDFEKIEAVLRLVNVKTA